jgi:hypothetical protein
VGSNTTGNYRFFKPGIDDLVAPDLDMEPHLNTLDSRVYGLTRYRVSTINNPDITGMENGWKVLDQKTGRIKYFYYDPVTGPQLLNVPKVNNTNPWNPINLVGGWVNNDVNDIWSAPAWRYLDGDVTRVELKGRITGAGNTIPNNTSITVTGNDAVPRPTSNRFFGSQPGTGNTNNESNNASRILITNVGLIAVVHYGSSTAGAIENYITLDNITYTTL